jgi:hypothetical protein
VQSEGESIDKFKVLNWPREVVLAIEPLKVQLIPWRMYTVLLLCFLPPQPSPQLKKPHEDSLRFLFATTATPAISDDMMSLL